MLGVWPFGTDITREERRRDFGRLGELEAEEPTVTVRRSREGIYKFTRKLSAKPSLFKLLIVTNLFN